MSKLTLVVGKHGDLRWLGHRDFARALERALRRAGLRLELTRGFHPHPVLRLPEPLPVGVASEAGERFVVAFAEPAPGPAEVAGRLGPTLPPGLPLLEVLEGSAPEPIDVPLWLELRGDPAGLAPVLGAAGLAERLGLAAVGAAPFAGGILVQLVPQRGRRVSVAAFLATLERPELDVVRVKRPLQSPGPPLDSWPPFVREPPNDRPPEPGPPLPGTPGNAGPASDLEP